MRTNSKGVEVVRVVSDYYDLDTLFSEQDESYRYLGRMEQKHLAELLKFVEDVS